MKNIKTILATAFMTAAIFGGTVSANAGILLSDFAGQGQGEQSCSTKSDTNVDSGILVTFTGILVTFTGILVTLTNETKDEPCAIIIHD